MEIGIDSFAAAHFSGSASDPNKNIKAMADLLERVQLDHAIRQGLARAEFVLHYQPRVDVLTGAIVVAAVVSQKWGDARWR